VGMPVLANSYYGTAQGATFQISELYLAMVRSLAKIRGRKSIAQGTENAAPIASEMVGEDQIQSGAAPQFVLVVPV